MKEIICLIIIIISVHLMNCSLFDTEGDKFTIGRMDYPENKLRMDGYYYYEVEPNLIHIYFFYKNGLILDGTSARGSSGLSVLESYYRDGSYYSTALKYYSFGPYRITEDSIYFEMKEESSGALHDLWQYYGKIISDTSFEITKKVRIDNKYLYTNIQRYYFRQFVSKPDSTCSYLP